MILDFFTYFSSRFYKYCSLPFYKLWCVITFFIKYIFFGYENAFLSLSRYDKFNVKLIIKLLGAKIGENCVIESGIRFHNCNNLRNLEIGNNCHVGKDCFFDLRDKVSIYNNVTISMNTTFITHQDLGESRLSTIYKPSSSRIIVKNNSYIGSNSIILKGVIVEENSIIAASSCVTKSIEINTLNGGIPAKKIKDILGI